MRIMIDMIEDSNMHHELEDNAFYLLGWMDDMDEDSDQEDPEKNLKEENVQLKKESEDRLALCNAVQGALECRAMATDLERARMQLEDLRAHILR